MGLLKSGVRVRVEDLKKVLGSFQYRIACEADLQEGLARVLTASSIPFQKEFRLSAKDRIDFLLDSGVGIEVKVQGSTPDLIRQLARYAADPRVVGLLVVTTKRQHLAVPSNLVGVPVAALHISPF